MGISPSALIFMKYIISKSLKRASLPPSIQLPLDSTEEQIVNFLRSAAEDIGIVVGHKIGLRICGGWVRDKFLNNPSKDIDITVDTMGGDQFAAWLHKVAIQRYGQQQEVVTEAKTTEERPEQIKNLAVAFLRIFGQDVEILPLRGNEVYEEGNRNPLSTQSAGPEQDAFRRDLTINSLFYNINTGQVEDFTGMGYDDLLTMTLRTPTRRGHLPIDEATRILTEDPLRLLRILRFQARYSNSKIAPEVLEAMADPKVQHQIVRRLYGDTGAGIVPERTADELRKLLMGKQPDVALRTMYEVGLLQKLLLLPSEYNPLEMDQKNKHHALTIIEHTLAVVKNVNDLSKEFGLDNKQRMMMNFSALYHDIGKLDPRSHKNKEDGTRGYTGDPANPDHIAHEQASQERWDFFADALKLSDEEKSTVSELVLNHMNPHSHVEGMENDPTDQQLRRYLRKNPSWVFQYIHAMADTMSKDTEPNPEAADPYRANLERLKSLAPTADSFGNSPPVVELLKGQEIMQLVGLPPRPPVQPGGYKLLGYIEVVKEAIREAQDQNPQIIHTDAVRIVQDLVNLGRMGQGVLAPYFRNVV